MVPQHRSWFTMLAALLFLSLAFLQATPVSAASVVPVTISGNPTCKDLGYGYGFKPQPEPPPSGTYTFPDGINTVKLTAYPNSTTGPNLDWSSTIALDAVIMKGGKDGANVYTYPAEVTSDTGLVTPNNPNGQPANISHIEFCYDYELQVTKSATTSLTRTNTWTIDKTVDPEKLDLFTGDSGDVNYTITVDKTSVDSDWAVAGTITIVNPDPGNGATITNVSDEVSGGLPMPVNCGVTFPYLLAAKGTLTCSYAGGLPDAATRSNTAVATTTGKVGGGSGSANVIFDAQTTVNNNGPVAINVDDPHGGPNGGTWAFGDDGKVSYSRTFTCDADKGEQPNTATIRETGQSDSATVTVNCYALEVKKDATTTFKRTHNWTIAKSVTPDTWKIFLGDDATSKYTVEVKKTDYTDSDWAVEGKIKVYNPAPMAATINSVADVVSPAIIATVDCGVTFPYALDTDKTLECSYKSALPSGDNRTNTATATLQNTPGGTTDFSGTAAVTFGAPTTEDNTKINVDDTNGKSWEFSDSGAVEYNSKPFTCEELGTYTHDNTATIRETGQSAKATVTVNCYDPIVTKDASTSLDRTYTWSIDKSADQSSLKLSVGQSFLVNYTVKVDAGYTDSGWAVSGKIEVYNSAPMAAMINSVTDELEGVGAIAVDCGVNFPYPLPGGETLVCTYSSSLPDTTSRTNTATAKQQTYSYDPDGNATPSGDYDYIGSANVNFTAPTVNHVDECIDVTDSYAGLLGTVCYDVDTLPKEIQYSWSVGSYTVCGDYTATNTATFTTNDTGATGNASWPIAVKVPCEGCSLTIGYWKTHAGLGPQADKVTALLPKWLGTANGLKSIQVTTATQAVALLEFKGSNGVKDASNGINKLYAQLLAAKLNIANGAGGSAVAATIAAADAFLANNNSSSWASLSRAQKNQVNAWAGTLDQYNNGLIGPGHCSEDGSVSGIGEEGALQRIFLPMVLNR